MKEVAKEIRKKLKEKGFTNRDVSVSCGRNYTINVVIISSYATYRSFSVSSIVKDCYYKEEHSWLCLCFNGVWLPMKDSRGDV